MSSIHAIQIPLAHVGSVNAWLLRGKPLTLVDTGPRTEAALDALERGVRARGAQLEDIELVIGTHHHHDHIGLAATIKRRTGARVALLATAAGYAAHYPESVARDCAFSRQLMGSHGVPEELLDSADALWDYIGDTAESVVADVRLADGEVIRAGGRDLRALARPGHSATDTLLVDADARLALVGDHLLARISPNTEISAASSPQAPRSRPRVDYLDGLKRTARMPLERFLPGHGPAVLAAPEVIQRQIAQHRRRGARIVGVLQRGPASAFAVARQLWNDQIVRQQPLLVLWEVLGHLDLMLAEGIVAESAGEDGGWRYALSERAAPQPDRASR